MDMFWTLMNFRGNQWLSHFSGKLEILYLLFSQQNYVECRSRVSGFTKSAKSRKLEVISRKLCIFKPKFMKFQENTELSGKCTISSKKFNTHFSVKFIISWKLRKFPGNQQIPGARQSWMLPTVFSNQNSWNSTQEKYVIFQENAWFIKFHSRTLASGRKIAKLPNFPGKHNTQIPKFQETCK